MVKRLLVCSLMISVFFLMVVKIQASGPQKVAQRAKLAGKPSPIEISVFERQTLGDPVLFSDDFEGGKPNWVIDASWNHVPTAAGNRAYQPVSSWEPNNTNFSSASTSWHAKLGLDEELDFVISPVIYLPTEVTTGDVTSPLKGLKLGYNYDVDTPAGNSWHHLVGSAECWWHFTSTDPGAGASSWWMEPKDIQHWRQWLVTPAIDLASATAPVNLTFIHKYDSEVEFDYYSVDISTDNFVSYKTLAFYEGSTAQLSWTPVNLDISDFVGKTVKIRFSSKGDYGTAEGFWGIDEIKVSDATTTFFYDDGGEAGTSTIVKNGFAPGARFGSVTGSAHASPTWTAADPISVPGFGVAIFPGDSIRIAFQWESDGASTEGRGFFVDDVTLYGIGLLPFDIAALGATGFTTIAVDKKVNLGVIVVNNGLNSITATLQWTGEIANITTGDTVVVQPAMFGNLSVTDFASGATVVIPTNPAREWLVKEPGHYLFRGKVSYTKDEDVKNNSFSVDFMVYGAPYTNVVYQQDFQQRGGGTTLEDLGFTVINGGGCKATGLNVNKWEYDSGLIYGHGGALLSYAWGNLDPGSDVVAPYDSSEVLDEALITPEFDISEIGPNGTLFMRYYVYFRTFHPALGPPFGMQKTSFEIHFSIDGGKTWKPAFVWLDDDGLANDARRLPNYYYGTPVLPYTSYLHVDLTPALKMGGQKMMVKIAVKSENSFVTGVSFEDMVVYGGLDYARITDVTDVPNDQGKQVRVTWKASFNDLKLWNEGKYGDFEQHIVTHYNLWRVIPTTGLARVSAASDLEKMLSHPGRPGDSFVLGSTQYDFIATIPAHFDQVYNYVAPTLEDGVETGFMVSAHTPDPMVFVNSKVVKGKSVDNLAPHPPMNVMAIGQNNTNIISWEASPDEDVRYYSVYRSETSGNYPSTPLAYTIELNYTDATAAVGKTYYYVVTATDFGLNESKYSNETSVLTKVGDNPTNAIPNEFGLAQNYPNPFNPTTAISYQLPTSSHVVITVFNTKGQAIKTLVNQEMKAGYHIALWDGTDNAGQSVTSGIYFYQMKAGSFSDMRKMMLVR